MASPQRTAIRNADVLPEGHGNCGQTNPPEEVRSMRIAAFNRLTRTRLVSTGCAVAIGTFALTGIVATGTAEAATPTTYTVQPGDYLIKIANAEHVPGGWRVIASANNLTSPYIIQPGQVLKLSSGPSSGSTAHATPAVAKTTSSK